MLYICGVEMFPQIKNIQKMDLIITSKTAQSYVQKYGIPMSMSRLYKLTSTNGIPHRKTGKRLIFYQTELEKWCIEQITDKVISNYHPSRAIVKSAQRKSTY